MNLTSNSINSSFVGSQQSNKSFRVLIKNRITHESVDPQVQKNNQIKKLKSTIEDEGFQQAKKHLKKYIRNMKTSSKFGHYKNNQQTNRRGILEQQKQFIGTQRINRSLSSSRKQNQMNESLRASMEENHLKSQCLIGLKDKNYLKNNILENLPRKILKTFQKSLTQSHQDSIQTKNIGLPSLNEKNEQSSNQRNLQFFHTIQTDENVTSQNQRLNQLQNKIQSLINQKLHVLAKNSFISSSNQNIKAYKLLQKQMDRILEQIRKIKFNQEIFSSTLKNFQSQINMATINKKDNQINKNIEMLQKKVKIIEKLIAQKLFQSDSIKNQYLQKLKKHRRHVSQSISKRSKTSTIYRQANTLNPSKFKPIDYKKQSVNNGEETTNKASYQRPMNSYYILPRKQNFYNNPKLNQPLPRSTYNREYLIYGALPKSLISVRSNRKDNGVLNNTISPNQQKNLLKFSTYKEDFMEKVEKDPVNFKELDCYKNKFKSIQLNYGKEKNENKIVNNKSVNQFYEQYSTNPQNQQNTKDRLPSLQSPRFHSSPKSLMTKLNNSISHLQQTQLQSAMVQQQSVLNNHQFNHRIKSQIKHKNIFDQKYMLRKQLMNEKIHNYSNKMDISNTNPQGGIHSKDQ